MVLFLFFIIFNNIVNLFSFIDSLCAALCKTVSNIFTRTMVSNLREEQEIQLLAS